MANDPKSLISDLIYMVMADGKIKPSEIQFIEKLSKRMSVPMDEVYELFENPKKTRVPISEAERITHFYRLMLVMKVDGETHVEELIALEEFGLNMGIRPGVAEQIRSKMGEYKDGIVPPKELLKVFKAYYN